MGDCKRCGRGYEVGIKEFCSEECFKKDLQERINEATAKEKSHTNNLTKED
ncbi:hypothetical protein [Nitrosopumilus sp.]|uniref:hypothetical protein n=1 Tax=Nitrosopumilus sp. TaxID=2024843 RepID=UPI00247EA344|nr:hypothetical protein [Nitrosopumilus sp.]MCV0430169.1 hypothetical protein [Nitrosopumilus sp.]